MEYIEIGKIVNTHGLKGHIKMYSYTDNIENVLKLKKIYIEGVEYEIEESRFIQSSNLFVFKLKNINSIEDTELLINKFVKREFLKEELDEKDSFFIKDLIGINVYDEKDELIGKLKEVYQTGANDVYEIVLNSSKPIFIPAIADVVISVDIVKRKMVVKIMEGLI